jgi:hypothetical protein
MKMHLNDRAMRFEFVLRGELTGALNCAIF